MRFVVWNRVWLRGKGNGKQANLARENATLLKGMGLKCDIE